MKKEFLSLITNAIGVEPVFINSALVSAQNRQRYYWCNWKVTQPEDRGIMLADILESDYADRDKSHCLDANYFKGGNLKSYFEKNRRQLVFINQKGRGNNPGGLRALDGKAPALTSNSYEHNNHVVSGIELHTRGIQEMKATGKSYALTAGAIKGGKALVGTKENYRKLTPRECGRLQTIPEPILENILNSGVSNTQLYKMFGNGWTIEVIAHIFKQMPIKQTTPEKITVEPLKMSNDLWSTPPEVFNALDMEFKFDFDVCAENQTAQCLDYWTIEDDALSKNWAVAGSVFENRMGSYLWCNPPYSKILPWVVKAIEAQAAGRGTVMLVMCDPSVKWFSLAAQFASEIRFVTEGRLAFLKNGKPQSGNNKGSAIFVFDPHRIGAGHVSFVTRETLLSKGKVNALEVAA